MNSDATLNPPPADTASPGGGVPHLGFLLGTEVYAVPLARLREVVRLPHLRRIPGTGTHVAGLVNLRGEIVCALDTHAILGIDQPGHGRHFLIALRDFNFPVGLVVDSIFDVLSIDPDTVTDPPGTWRPERAAFVRGACTVAAMAVGLLDLDRVVLR
jgi:purine-binding chemotaxis protein CheW